VTALLESGREAEPVGSGSGPADHPGPSAGPRRAGLRRALLVGAVVAVAVGARLFWVVHVHNPDGAVLAWGSGLVAQGELDPYAAAVERAEADPVQPDEVRPLPLAVGYGVLYLSGLTLAAADAVGIVDLGAVGDRVALGAPNPLTTVFKLSFLVPELLLAVAASVVSTGAARRVALVLIALNPLVFYAYGQGLPDLWQAAVVMGSLACALVHERRLGPDGEPCGPHRRMPTSGYAYASVALLVLGAFSVKLMPLVLLPGLVVHLWRHPAGRPGRTGRFRAGLVAVTVVSLLVGGLPYLLNELAWLSLTARFEVPMVLGANPVQAIANVAPAPLWSAVTLVAFVWLFARHRQPPDALASWFVVVPLVLAFTAGGVQQFMLWGTVGLLLLAPRAPLPTALLLVGAGAATVYSFVTFPWFDDLLLDGVGVDAPVGGGSALLVGLPGGTGYGAAVAALLVVGTGLAVAVCLAGPDGRLARQLGDEPRRWLAWVAAVVVVALPLALVAATLGKVGLGTGVLTMGELTPPGAVALPTAIPLADPQEVKVPSSALAADAGRWPLRAVTLRAHARTLPSTSRVEVRVESDAGAVATGSMSIAELEPRTELGPVRLDLDRPVPFTAGTVTVSCTPPPDVGRARACDAVFVEGSVGADGRALPEMDLVVAADAGPVTGRLLGGLAAPASGVVVLVAAAAGAVAATTMRRRSARR
jgi:hypothetical protein